MRRTKIVLCCMIGLFGGPCWTSSQNSCLPSFESSLSRRGCLVSISVRPKALPTWSLPIKCAMRTAFFYSLTLSLLDQVFGPSQLTCISPRSQLLSFRPPSLRLQSSDVMAEQSRLPHPHTLPSLLLNPTLSQFQSSRRPPPTSLFLRFQSQ